MLSFFLVELRDTEVAHKEAMTELDKMKDTMEKMEQERAEMIAEVGGGADRERGGLHGDGGGRV